MGKNRLLGIRSGFLTEPGIAVLLSFSLPLRLIFVSPLSPAAVIPVAMITLIFIASFFSLLKISTPMVFRRLFFILIPLHMAMLIFISITVSPAFFKNIFHVAVSFDLIFLFRLNCFLETSRQNAIRIIIFHLPLLGAFLIWLVGIGTIVVLRLPNWEENVVLNIYHLVLCGFFLYCLTRLFPYKTIKLAGDAILFMDIDLGNFLPAADRLILKALIQASDHKLECQVLSALVKQGGTGADRACHEAGAISCQEKISSCPEYRTLYNKTLGLKKLLEAFDLGTITAEAGHDKARFPTWRLEFARLVRIVGASDNRSDET